MSTPEVLETLAVADWSGPFTPDVQARAVDALEAGRVLVLPRLEFHFDPCETGFLDPSVAGGDRKNISLDPAPPPATPRRWSRPRPSGWRR